MKKEKFYRIITSFNLLSISLFLFANVYQVGDSDLNKKDYSTYSPHYLLPEIGYVASDNTGAINLRTTKVPENQNIIFFLNLKNL